MVAIATVRAANAAKAAAASAEPSGRPYVAVFAGGTSGIGERAVRALASNHGPSAGPSRRPLRAYIIGRKQAVADALMAECAAACGPGGEFVFIKTEDLAMLRDVDAACAEIARLEEAASAREGHEAKIDLLVATQGVLYFGGRMDTSEGLDRHFSLMYYSRLRLVTNLLPLLTSLPSGSPSSTPGHVVSVFNPNLEGKLAASDLSLRGAENFGFVALSSHIALFTTFAFEALAARHPGRLALSHYYPGFVMTDIASKSPIPRWASLAWKLCTPVVKLFAVGDDDCGQYVDFLASGRYAAARGGDQVEAAAAADSLEVAVGADGGVGSGAYRVHWNGDIIQPKKQTDAYRRDGMVEKVWEHTLAAFAAVDAGKAFDG